MPRAREFFSPLPLLAVALLALNDHFFKAAFHNGVTGKLSDFAGCFFLPLFLSAVLAFVPALQSKPMIRVLLGCAATLALFVPIKLSIAAAGLVAETIQLISIPLGLGAQHIVADPTDLLALPMVAIAALYARRMTA